VLDGAQYVIVVPPKWNGGLVIFAHGYQAEGSGSGLASPEPLDHYLTNHGYAWASSGYRSKGYRPDLFLLDLLALRAQFHREVWPASVDNHSRTVDGRPCRHRLA